MQVIEQPKIGFTIAKLVKEVQKVHHPQEDQIH